MHASLYSCLDRADPFMSYLNHLVYAIKTSQKEAEETRSIRAAAVRVPKSATFSRVEIKLVSRSNILFASQIAIYMGSSKVLLYGAYLDF